MVLNDVFDFAIDAKERPFRPLPSGQIGLRDGPRRWLHAAGAGRGRRLAGRAVCRVRAGGDSVAERRWWRRCWRLRVLLYNGFLKLTPLGPLGMGLCRFLNVLLGMSTADHRARSSLLSATARPSCSRRRHRHLHRRRHVVCPLRGRRRAEVALLVAAMVVMAAGVVDSRQRAATTCRRCAIEPQHVLAAAGLLMVTVLRRCGVAAVDPVPREGASGGEAQYSVA